MSSHFPVVGVFGSGGLVQLLDAPASDLGIPLVNLSESNAEEMSQSLVITSVANSISFSLANTLESSGNTLRPNASAIDFVTKWNEKKSVHGDMRYSVLIARSPHGQASAWAPTEIVDGKPPTHSITPAPSLSERQVIVIQKLALDVAMQAGVVGVMEVEIIIRDREISAGCLTPGPTETGVWTIEGARTSQFEQHLRAILDLPLGDPSLRQPFVVSASFAGEGNMYRPYLHLMARSPRLKFHQYRSEIPPFTGHVTALGRDLLDLQECVTHAVEYMSGDIDE